MKLDISKERQLELQKIIDDTELLHKKNSELVKKIINKHNNKILKLDIVFYKKLYKNIPIIIDKENILYSFINAKILFNFSSFKLCEIEINSDYWNNNTIIRFKYSNDYDNIFDYEIIKMKYLKIISDRILKYQENFKLKREKIISEHKLYINEIDKHNTYKNIITLNKRILNNIKNELLFEPNLKYIFDDTVSFKNGNKKSTITISALKILKTTNIFCNFEVTRTDYNNNIFIQEYRKKKYIVLDLLKNKYHFDKNVLRERKLKRLLEGMA